MSEREPDDEPDDPGEPGEGRGPQGSAYEARHGRRRSRSARRRLRGWISWQLVSAVAWVFPYLYCAYCWFVWRTSRVDDRLTGPILDTLDRHARMVSLLWHQEVFTVAYGFRHLDGHTVASTGNFGRIITRMLERCNFTVFRGGSSSGSARRRRVLPDMIRHMEREPRVPYGITVDGSHGPPFQMKGGSLAIARRCGAPVWLVRTWYSRRIQLGTWDRTAIPLPFGEIRSWAVGPYWIEPDATADELERARVHLETELLELADLSFRALEQYPDAAQWEGFPPGWRPRWLPGQLGLKRRPWDLDPDAAPDFAHRPPPPSS